MRKKFYLIFMALFSFVGLASCSLPLGNLDIHHVHSYKEKKVLPTCTEDGYYEYECECGDSYRGTSIPATGHTVVIDEAIPKTCTESGLSEGSHCSVCGTVLVAQEIVPASHEWEYVLKDQPTCTEPGTSSGMICKDCGSPLPGEEIIPALGHKYIETKKTTSKGHSYIEYECERCKDAYADSLVVDYTKSYEYQTFSTNSLYQSHKSHYQAMYKTFYDDCMRVLESKQDYKIPSGNNHVEISTYTFGTALSKDEAFAAANTFVKNNPQFYFLSDYIYSTTGAMGSVRLAMDPLYFKGSERAACEQNIKNMEHEVYALYQENPSMTDKDKAKLIHDYIIEKIDYQLDNDRPSLKTWAHNIMGVADMDDTTGGVCECYARTYLYLSHFLGIESIIVMGVGNGGGHAWNYTKIDGKWYGVDVTWDDQYSIIYDYFLASASEMNEKHTPGFNDITHTPALNESFQIALPTLSETSYE